MAVSALSTWSGTGVRSGHARIRRNAGFRQHHVDVDKVVREPCRGQKCRAIESVASLVSKDMFILTCKATFKLGLACSAVMLLMKSGRLPAATPQVLSRVAFNVTIPCTLLIKSAETLASSQGDPRYLMVSATAIMQVRPTSETRIATQRSRVETSTRAKHLRWPVIML